MSVPCGEREQSRLIAHDKTEDMIVHTLRITSNPKVFDPSLHVLVDMINDCALGIGADVWEANGIRVGNDPDLWQMRHDLQVRACHGFDRLLYLVGIAKKAYRLRTRKYHAWVNAIREARDIVRAWRDTDSRRYGSLSGRRG